MLKIFSQRRVDMSDSVKKTGRGRLTEIATVLASYGFGHIYRTKMGRKDDSQDAESLRHAFEELGTTFIKIGQILSTRPDLLPSDYIEELAKLQDQAPPFPFEEIERTFEEEFDRKIETDFQWIDKEPLASASIAQVHRARTLEGREVIIKVQRPDMEEDLLRDIQLFSRIISMAPETIKSFVIDAEVALAEVEKATKIELDFRNEVNALVRFRRNNKDRPVVTAPEPLLEYVSKRVLVEDYIPGINGLNIDKIVQAGYDKEDFVEKFVYTFLTQVFEDGFFHGDPHPGNIIISDKKIVYIDFGLYGELSEQNRERLMKILDAIVFEDVDGLMNLLLQMAIVKSDVDRFVLYEDLEHFFYVYVAKDVSQIDIGILFNDILSVTHKHGLIMPNDFIMLAKSMGVIEGVVSDFKTEVNVMDVAKTYLKESDGFSPLRRITDENVGLKAIRVASDTLELPTSLKKGLETIANGRTRINLEILNWEKKSIEVNKMVNRLVFAIIIAALVLASAIIIVSASRPGLSNLSILIFFGAGLMGLWLLISIIRSGTL
jgi:ubiquinone biosynthesis protein